MILHIFVYDFPYCLRCISLIILLACNGAEFSCRVCFLNIHIYYANWLFIVVLYIKLMKKGRRFVEERTAKFTYLIVDNDYFLACCGWRSLSDDLSYYYPQHEITSFLDA